MDQRFIGKGWLNIPLLVKRAGALLEHIVQRWHVCNSCLKESIEKIVTNLK